MEKTELEKKKSLAKKPVFPKLRERLAARKHADSSDKENAGRLKPCAKD